MLTCYWHRVPGLLPVIASVYDEASLFLHKALMWVGVLSNQPCYQSGSKAPCLVVSESGEAGVNL